jgi:tetratricopeptide (TPR) repeat protein
MHTHFIILFGAAIGLSVWLGLWFHRDEAARVVFEARVPQAALLLVSTDENLLKAIGEHYFGKGDYNLALAEEAYRKLLHVNPETPLAHYELARIYFAQGNFLKALSEINTELAKHPDNKRALYVRGLIYGYKNDSDDLRRAEADFRSFTEWSTGEWAGYNDLVWILVKQKKFNAAKTAITTAFEKAHGSSTNPWLWNSLGVVELHLGNTESAHQAFARAHELAFSLEKEIFQNAYPGNDPRSTEHGFAEFKNSIAENMEKTKGY